MVTRATVLIATATEKEVALGNALNGAGFWDELARRREASGKEAAQFRVVIKTSPAGPWATDPELVAHLVRQLRESSYTRATVMAQVGDGDTISYDFGSVLGRQPVALMWHDADYRISFAACRTDPRAFYATTIANVLDCVPNQALGSRATFAERAVLIADRLPLHFALLNAWRSRDGVGRRLRSTETIIASVHPLGVDWVAGEKMGLDPALNPVVQEALHRWGRIELVRRGNQTPWDGWRNVRPLLVFTRAWLDPQGKRESSGWFARAIGLGVTRRAPSAERLRRTLA